RQLRDQCLSRPVQLMSCAGGVVMPHDAGRQAVMLVNSGPVGGLVAARRLGLSLGLPDIVTTDMGGTSFDVGLIHDGELETEQRPCLDQGLPVQVPAVRVVTIGAGGGSIARARDGRLLVGPDSAGAEPGPACYGTGGTAPTVTDALVVLGVIDPDYFLGGRKRLDAERAARAVRDHVAEPLGMTIQEAAAGIHHIVTARMADLIRKVTVESGHDPRQFTVFAYGGASPAHAALYARAVGAREVVVPAAGSVFSALGCVCSDLKYAYAQARPLPLRPDPDVIAAFNQTFRLLEERALADLRRLGPAGTAAVLTRRLDLRYEGQLNELTVPWTLPGLDASQFGELRRAFEAGYQARFGAGTTRSEAPMEAVTFRVEALLHVPDLATWTHPVERVPGAAARKGGRRLHLRGWTALEADVYEADRLAPGVAVEGPAIVERPDTTVLVPPGHRACRDEIGNLRIQTAPAPLEGDGGGGAG
ncbi:MAG TPA: hydantoinase/oxoprolinase family protein, partial [Candidatus Dormibacteraeota bacterium]|nr:hydantoinase/oxoprolinase family protein [Candidatus Dormibacteraeota bacterium]